MYGHHQDAGPQGECEMATRMVKGTAVVSLADGAKLGTVDRVFLDPTSKAIVGFTFHSGGFFGHRSASMVDVADVHAIGPDAITLTNASAVRSEVAIGARCDGLIDLDDLLKRKVITEGGQLVGQVTAIEFDQDAYALARIEVAAGGGAPDAAIPAARITNIGTDLIVVADPVRQESARTYPQRAVARIASVA